MTSLVAARTRLSTCLSLLPSSSQGLLQMCSAAVSSSQASGHQHCNSHHAKALPHCQKTLSHTLSGCKLCVHEQKLAYSGVPLKVPQVDLEGGGKGGERGDDPGRTRKSSSEILQSLSPEDARKLKIIKLEFDVTEQMNGKVPEVMTDDHWLHALQLDSKSKRLHYYAFLRKTEGLKKAKQRRQHERLLQSPDHPEHRPEPREKNTIFFTVREAAFRKAGNYRLAHAMQFGQPLVFDMDYEQYMRNQDCQNLVFQLLLSYSKNRDDSEPFHLMLTSINPEGRVLKMLQHAHMAGPNFMGTMTDQSYLHLFPRERLVYLSPHAGQNLQEVSHDDIYIVGGFVDKINTQPVSLARAKEQGIRVAKFPLDNYLLWGCGSKSLTVDQVMAILLEQRRTGDWSQAFRAIPQRKLNRDSQ